MMLMVLVVLVIVVVMRIVRIEIRKKLCRADEKENPA